MKLKVYPSTFKIAKEFIKKYHYLGHNGCLAGHVYVFEYNNNIEGVLIWNIISAPQTVVGAFGLERNDQKGFFELGRLVMSPDLNHKNLTSFFLSHSIRLLKKIVNIRALITYADSTRHTGIVYQACNFKYYGLTAKRTDFWVNGKIKSRGKTKGIDGIWRPRSQKHRYMIVFDKSLSILWTEKSYPKMR